MSDSDDVKPETLTAQALGWVEPTTRAVVPAIQPSTTFERDADNSYPAGRKYIRDQNANFDQVEQLLARLEKGADALLYASGMAAAVAVFQALPPDSRVVAPAVMYWGLRKWLIEVARPAGLTVTFAEVEDPEALARAVEPGCDLVWLETPANPMWSVTDIAGAVEIARQVGAKVAVDNTVATPVLTRPLDLGADIVMHSATKYLNGHSDVLAGALVARDGDDPLWQRIRTRRGMEGPMLGSFEAWLLLRGMRTLHLRVRAASAAADAIARHFQGDARVERVLYPGLAEHPGHDVARRQMEGGFGGMLSIRVKDRGQGGEAAAIETAARLRVFKRATSLGGVESLVEHRASIEGPTTPVPGDLLRFSVGIEAVEDLIADIDQALG